MACIDDDRLSIALKSVQENLFIIGAELSSVVNERFLPKHKISPVKVTELEKIIADTARFHRGGAVCFLCFFPPPTAYNPDASM